MFLSPPASKIFILPDLILPQVRAKHPTPWFCTKFGKGKIKLASFFKSMFGSHLLMNQASKWTCWINSDEEISFCTCRWSSAARSWFSTPHAISSHLLSNTHQFGVLTFSEISAASLNYWYILYFVMLDFMACGLPLFHILF